MFDRDSNKWYEHGYGKAVVLNDNEIWIQQISEKYKRYPEYYLVINIIMNEKLGQFFSIGVFIFERDIIICLQYVW